MQFTKPGIFEADLHSDAVAAASPLFSALLDECDQLQSTLNENGTDTKLVPKGRSSRTVKLQYNTGFPLLTTYTPERHNAALS